MTADVTDRAGDAAVVLCVITYHRPVGLERLLAALRHLDQTGADITVVIVDNDVDGSAEPIVAAARSGHPLRLIYEREPTRGITQARNTALAVALGERSGSDGNADVVVDGPVGWIGWMDDDEAPRPDWLQRLLSTQARLDADVVMGPSSPIFEGRAAPWICAAFDSPHFETGSEFPFNYARTSGVIVRAAAVPPERFDDRLALTGGEDRVLFTRVHRAGGRFVWDDDAVVDEWVPSTRMTTGWLIRRWFRKGVTRSLAMLILDRPSILRRARRVVGGLGRAGMGAGLTIWALRRGRSAAFAVAPRIFFGLGASYGALGFGYQEYRRIHGQ